VDTLDAAMEKYKGGIPNHERGCKVARAPVMLDESLPAGMVAVTLRMMERMKAREGDLVYMTDSRWWLGGLRSNHVKLAAPRGATPESVAMSKATFDDAFLLDGRPVTMEKIF